jgi:hypothetical protein
VHNVYLISSIIFRNTSKCTRTRTILFFLGAVVFYRRPPESKPVRVFFQRADTTLKTNLQCASCWNICLYLQLCLLVIFRSFCLCNSFSSAPAYFVPLRLHFFFFGCLYLQLNLLIIFQSLLPHLLLRLSIILNSFCFSYAPASFPFRHHLFFFGCLYLQLRLLIIFRSFCLCDSFSSAPASFPFRPHFFVFGCSYLQLHLLRTSVAFSFAISFSF